MSKIKSALSAALLGLNVQEQAASWAKLGETVGELAGDIKWRQEFSGGVLWPCVYLLDRCGRPVFQIYESMNGVWSVLSIGCEKPNFSDSSQKAAIMSALAQYRVYGFDGNRDQSGLFQLTVPRTGTRRV